MNNLADTRNRINITQHQLAAWLGWSQSRIGNYEAGSRTPDLKTCRELVAALNALGAECTLDSVFPPSVDEA